jgi:dTDP-4-amino-4,6-dideoxygalactose transaminase
VLRVKLRHLARGNEQRRAHAARYRQEFAGTEGILLPFEAEYAEHVYHIFAVRVQERDEVMQFLERDGIGCGIHYPVPVHLQQAYASLGYRKGSYPISERTSAEFISLPMFPELTQEQIGRVVRATKNALPAAVLA